MNEPAAALELSSIFKRFDHVLALDDASLSVRAAAIQALLGENGAGTTTLMPRARAHGA